MKVSLRVVPALVRVCGLGETRGRREPDIVPKPESYATSHLDDRAPQIIAWREESPE